MATEPVGRVALMSIRPRYVRAILNGSKTVEFRKRPLAEDVTHVVIYSTLPDKAVTGYFTTSGQETTTPSALWEALGDKGAINKEDFLIYYAGRSHATGIRVKRATRLRRPLDLATDLGLRRPPQSFQYLAHDLFDKVLAAA